MVDSNPTPVVETSPAQEAKPTYDFTYQWEVTNLKVKDEGDNKNSVVQSYWTVIGTDKDGYSGRFEGTTSHSSASVSPGAFIPLESLTQAVVLSWVQEYINNSPEYMNHINERIASQIPVKVNPIVEVPLPWTRS
jgi:hypothetical protein